MRLAREPACSSSALQVKRLPGVGPSAQTSESFMRYPPVEQVARKMSEEPDSEFLRLSALGAQAAARGCFTKAEFLEVCRWKSTRRIALCRSNSDQVVRRCTAVAFAATEEEERIEALLQLSGVAVPTASALLAAFSPVSFGVIDIRCWQFLHSVGAVTQNCKGINLSVRNWLQYLDVLRNVAKRVGTTPRLVEISLYWEHRNTQKAPLYSGQAYNHPIKRTCLRQAACVRR